MENKEELDGMLMGESQDERIGFGRRLGAYLLDGFVVLIIGSIVGLVIGESLSILFFSEQMDQFDQLYDLLGDGYEGLIEKMIGVSAGISLIGLSLFFMEGAFGQSFAKMMLGIMDLIKQDYFPKGSSILAIHTGGLQGNKGMSERLGVKLPS